MGVALAVEFKPARLGVLQFETKPSAWFQIIIKTAWQLSSACNWLDGNMAPPPTTMATQHKTDALAFGMFSFRWEWMAAIFVKVTALRLSELVDSRRGMNLRSVRD